MYVRDKIIQNTKYDFSDLSKRAKSLKKIVKNPKDIERIFLVEKYKKRRRIERDTIK